MKEKYDYKGDFFKFIFIGLKLSKNNTFVFEKE